MRFIKLCLNLLIISILFQNCANQTPPTGGEKDKEAPKLVQSVPTDQSINYKDQLIELEFNELIKLNNAKEELIITPTIEQEYEIKYKKNKVIIEFKEPLDENTTYSLIFRESIQDLNEGNPAENLRIAFSTGSELDSLKVNGTINNPLINKPANDFIVGLYRISDTLDLLKQKPYYITKTDKNGKFRLGNIKSDDYRIATFKDKNKNLIIDSKSEPFGFSLDTIKLTGAIDSLSIPIQFIDSRPIELASKRQSGTVYIVKYNKFIVDYQIKSFDSLSIYHNFQNKEQNTIQFFHPKELEVMDSTALLITTYDSLYQQAVDTVFLKFEETTRKPSKLDQTHQLESIVVSDGRLSSTIKFNKPIKNINYDSAYIFLDSLNILQIDSSHFSYNDFQDKIQVEYILDQKYFEEPAPSNDSSKTESLNRVNKPRNELEKAEQLKKEGPTEQASDKSEKQTKKNEKVKPYIYYGPSTFISVENDSSKTIKTNLDFKQASQLAILHVEVLPSNFNHFIVQLIDKENKVIKSHTNETKFTFQHIVPGEYKLRTIIDTNNNGKWDPANILTNTKGEPVHFFYNSEGQQQITFRANWEVGPYIIDLSTVN